jgi:hypothetical protein
MIEVLIEIKMTYKFLAKGFNWFMIEVLIDIKMIERRIKKGSSKPYHFTIRKFTP